MKFSYLCVASHLLWASMSLGADGPAAGTLKSTALWELLSLYTLMNAAGLTAGNAAWDVAGEEVGHAAMYEAQTTAWDIVGGTAWDAAAEITAKAIGPTALQAAKVASRRASKVTIFRSDTLNTDKVGIDASTAAWQSVLSERQQIMKVLEDRLPRVTFLDAEYVHWNKVHKRLQLAINHPKFRMLLPEVGLFFTQVTLRIAHLTADNPAQEKALRTRIFAQPSIAGYLPQLKTIDATELTFLDFLQIMELRLSQRTASKAPAEGKRL